MGDELGLLNDPDWDAVPEHAGDNRWTHRQRMPWPTPADSHRIQRGIRALVAARAGLPHLHASVAAEVLDPRDPAVLLVARRHPLGPMLGAYNMAPEPRHVPLEVLSGIGLDPARTVDHLSGRAPRMQDDAVQLATYAAAWLVGRDLGRRSDERLGGV
jgi:amylosucrase